jgi:septal ring factor EnvC (AmiA/AmiB activator)
MMNDENSRSRSSAPIIHHSSFITWFHVFLVFLLAAAVLPAHSQSDYEKDLAAQRKELNAVRAKLEKEQRELTVLKKKKTVTLGELRKLENNIAATNRYLKKLEATERALKSSVNDTRADLREIEGRLSRRSRAMAKRARILYMSGRPENLLFVPGVGEGDFLQRAYLVRRLIAYDRRLVVENRADMGQKQAGLKKLLVQSEELEQFQRRKQQEVATFTRAKTSQQKTLKVLQSDETTRTRALRKLEENAKQLNAIIRALEKRRQEEAAKGRKGRSLETGTRYCAPVQGSVVSKYGLQYHATLGTSTKNLGIEIEGADGAPVRAAVSGEVAMITTIPGYGRGVILDNGSGYFTIYANLSGIRVSVGDAVKTCQEMASQASNPGRVYFEVRQGTRTLDPEAWLKGSR